MILLTSPVLYSKTYTHLLALGVRHNPLSASSGIFDVLRIHFQNYVIYVCMWYGRGGMGATAGVWKSGQLLDWFSPSCGSLGLVPIHQDCLGSAFIHWAIMPALVFRFLRKAEKWLIFDWGSQNINHRHLQYFTHVLPPVATMVHYKCGCSEGSPVCAVAS